MRSIFSLLQKTLNYQEGVTFMGRHLNPLEKELLIRQIKGNDRVTLYEFCTANNVSVNSFHSWVKQYEYCGLEALVRQDKTRPEGFPKSFILTEEYYKREILRLRIENERLKIIMQCRRIPMGKRFLLVYKRRVRNNISSLSRLRS